MTSASRRQKNKQIKTLCQGILRNIKQIILTNVCAKVAQLFTFHKVEESSNRFVVMVKLPLPFILKLTVKKIWENCWSYQKSCLLFVIWDIVMFDCMSSNATCIVFLQHEWSSRICRYCRYDSDDAGWTFHGYRCWMGSHWTLCGYQCQLVGSQGWQCVLAVEFSRQIAVQATTRSVLPTAMAATTSFTPIRWSAEGSVLDYLRMFDNF